MEDFQWVVYSRDNCQWCERVRQLLTSVDINYQEYKYEKNFTKEQFYKEFGEGATFPQVSRGIEHIGGCKETLHYLQKQKMI
mgnify:FL=1|tara:strand:+ start:415 stop:660 length:246 start_codon:yes stop_codon:yes gene_type:complete